MITCSENKGYMADESSPLQSELESESSSTNPSTDPSGTVERLVSKRNTKAFIWKYFIIIIINFTTREGIHKRQSLYKVSAQNITLQKQQRNKEIYKTTLNTQKQTKAEIQNIN